MKIRLLISFTDEVITESIVDHYAYLPGGLEVMESADNRILMFYPWQTIKYVHIQPHIEEMAPQIIPTGIIPGDHVLEALNITNDRPVLDWPPRHSKD